MTEQAPVLHRCSWAEHASPGYRRYHDTEWGVYTADDRQLFECLMLELFQSGLSFACIFEKRDALRAAFADFAPEAVAAYGEAEIERCLQNEKIIRSRRKIEAAVTDARVFLEIRQAYGSFAAYLETFTGKDIPCDPESDHSPVSDALASDLRTRGMCFLGTKTVYAFLQAAGRVNGHEKQCFLFRGTSPCS